MSIPRRRRLSLEPVPEPILTMSSSGQINPEYEDFVLGDEVESVKFLHWTAHLRYFFGWYDEEPEFSCKEKDLPRLRKVIADGVKNAGYPELAHSICESENESNLNEIIIKQYTDETNLYFDINHILRQAHSGSKLGDHSLSPWILQFNAALRMQPEFNSTVYRGVNMTASDIDRYKLGLMFEWASFVSASKDREVALGIGGNVLFDITPWGSYSMYGKRNPFDIAAQSVFPEEQEVVFPIACTYRVTNRQKDANRILISLETVDQY